MTSTGRTVDFLRRVYVRPDRRTLAELYASTDVFVSGSWYEGFALPPLEAMAIGTAVVTTDSGGVREYARHGYNCLMVPPRDHRAIAEAVLALLRQPDLRRRLGENGRRTALRFSQERSSERFLAALRVALAASQGHRPSLAVPLAARPGDWAERMHRLAQDWLNQGRWPEALHVLTIAAAFAPADADTWANLAVLHASCGQWRAAVRAGCRALRLGARDQQVVTALSGSLQRLGHEKLAESLQRLGQAEGSSPVASAAASHRCGA